MKVGDKLDPMALGHRDIDVKTLLKEAGYVVPQVSMTKLPELPASVAAEIAAKKATRSQYSVGEKTKVFTCKACGARCSAAERTEVATGQRFYACGACDTVVEVL